jgi:hypothetical protein
MNQKIPYKLPIIISVISGIHQSDIILNSFYIFLLNNPFRMQVLYDKKFHFVKNCDELIKSKYK